MSECSLSFASVIVHRNVCMHTLHGCSSPWRCSPAASLRKEEAIGSARESNAGAVGDDTADPNHPHRRGGVRRGPRSRRAQEPGAARAVATAAANCRGERTDRSSFERTRHAPLEAFCALASLSARALADFCALPPPIVTVGRRVREQYCFTGENCRVQGVRQAERKTPTLNPRRRLKRALAGLMTRFKRAHSSKLCFLEFQS